MTRATARWGWGLVIGSLLAACGQQVQWRDEGQGGTAGARAVTATGNTLLFPAAVTAVTGTVSDQPLSVLAVKDQSGTADDWDKYRDFEPARNGLDARIVFSVPAGINLTTATLGFSVNYRGWNKSTMRWQFHVYDHQQGAWVYLGDNAAAKSWSWSLLSFSAQGQLARYVRDGKLQLKYSTTSRRENSNLDYVAAVLVGATPAPTPAPTVAPTAVPTPAPTAPPASGQLPGTGRIPAGKLYGITIDSIDNTPAIVTSLSKLSRRATTRIVFDEWVAASYYADAVSKIYDVSYVMGEILDSFYMKEYTLSQFQSRVHEYMNALAPKVDIWEMGNEINGEWLGPTSDTVAKMTAAYDIVKSRGGVTSLTLYYNEDCWEKPSHEMFTWAEANIPTRMKQGLDYLLVSYYEDDCNGLQPNWKPVFERLYRMFPNSRIGFGEVGTKYADRKAEYIRRYYSMELAVPHFIGGWFWWYGRQDLVPYTTSYWSVFNQVISTH